MPQHDNVRLFSMVFIWVIGLATSADAAQRMGLLPTRGAISIPANGQKSFDARCVDEHEGPPTTSTRYVQVLNGSSTAVMVTVDGRSIPLQEAIDKKLVSVSGTAPPIPGSRINPDSLFIKNHTKNPIEVTVSSGAVLGESGRRTIDYDVPSLLTEGVGQRDLWAQQARIFQAESDLNAIGYSVSGIPRSPGATKLQDMIRSFQKDNGLPVDGVVNDKTSAALRDVKSKKDRLQRINKNETPFLLLTMEYQQSTSIYALYGPGSGKPIYRGDDFAVVIRELNQTLEDKAGRTLYLDISNFSPDKRDGVVASLRHSNIVAKILERNNGSTTFQDQFFELSKLQISQATEPVVVTEGQYKWFYQCAINVIHGFRKCIFHVYGKSRELVQAFVRSLQHLVTQEQGEVSPAILINKVREQLKRTGELKSDDDLLIKFQDSMGTIQFVRVDDNKPGIGGA